MIPMKQILIIFTTIIIGSVSTFAQQNISKEWAHAYSKEGRLQWKNEYTFRYRVGFFSDGVILLEVFAWMRNAPLVYFQV